MPKPYPDPSFNNSAEMIGHVNTITEGWGTITLCIAIPLVVFIILKKKFYTTSQALLVANFAGFFFSAILWAGNFVQNQVMIIFLLLTVGSAIFSVLDQN